MFYVAAYEQHEQGARGPSKMAGLYFAVGVGAATAGQMLAEMEARFAKQRPEPSNPLAPGIAMDEARTQHMSEEERKRAWAMFYVAAYQQHDLAARTRVGGIPVKTGADVADKMLAKMEEQFAT